MLWSSLLICHTVLLLIGTYLRSCPRMSLFYVNLWLIRCFSWKVFLIFLNLMFLINSTKSFSKGISYFNCLRLQGDFSPCRLSSMLLSVLSLLFKCIAFHFILTITISTFFINCNKYVFSEGVEMFLIEYPKFTFCIMQMNPSNSAQLNGADKCKCKQASS